MVPNRTIGAIMFGLVSQSSNPIFTLEIPGKTGVIGMTPCPGIRLESAKRSNPQKTLKRDIALLLVECDIVASPFQETSHLSRVAMSYCRFSR